MPGFTSLCKSAQFCAGLHKFAQGCTSLCKSALGCASLHKFAQGFASLCEFAPSCASLHKSVPGCASLHKFVSGCTSLCKSVQVCVRLCKSVQVCTWFYKSMQACTSVGDQGIGDVALRQGAALQVKANQVVCFSILSIHTKIDKRILQNSESISNFDDWVLLRRRNHALYRVSN